MIKDASTAGMGKQAADLKPVQGGAFTDSSIVSPHGAYSIRAGRAPST